MDTTGIVSVSVELVNETAVNVLLLSANDFAVNAVVNWPAIVAVVVDAVAPQSTEPPEAICAKLGCPPEAELLKPVQVILAGFVG